ncbi:MAG: DUF305 domain-containing protein [Alphaproteobacteria bacterium]|nr:DUF305 domain-containing protein [Alphaproteobacteria bacterium]MBU2380238.1 DUF305 domain-containing protein [Alphaproteobacteria bacterium]
MLAGVVAAQAAGGAPAPIVQPGAPGAASRVISAETAVAMSRPTFTEHDVAFMQHMIVHHAQAVEMVEMLETQGSDPTVKLLGRRISLSQEAEMALMRGWLTDRGQSVEMPMAGMDHSGMEHSGMDHSAHAGHAMSADDTPVMAGMLSPRQMRTLSAATGTEFDRLFLTGMIQHHQGAIDMVDALMDTPDAADDPLLSDFANSVVGDQTAEIARMQTLLSDL